MRRQVYTDNFNRGLQTTEDESGLEFPGFINFENVRVNSGDMARRLGRRLIDRAGSNQAALTFNGSSQYVEVPVSGTAHDFGKQTTVEAVFKPTTLATSTTYPIIHWNHATDVPLKLAIVVDGADVVTLSGSFRTSSTYDRSSSATISANDTIAVQLVRDSDDNVTLYVHNLTTDVWTTDTFDATATLGGADLCTPGGSLRFGRDDGANYFTGTIDYVRFFSISRVRHDDLWMRWPDPYCSYCLADYNFKEETGSLVHDRSRFGNAGLSVGSPSAATTLTHQTSTIQAIQPYTTRDGVRRVVVVAGGLVHDGSVT